MTKCKRCNGKAHGDCGYCINHVPDEMRCARTTDKNKRCRLPRMTGVDYCKTHLLSCKRGTGSGNSGWVYVYDTTFRKDDVGTFKIGRSMNIQFRVSELKSGNPYGKMLFAGFVGDKAKKIESELHKKYLDKWIEREMFSLTKEEVSQIYKYLKSI